ncbi:hypothetical protein B843_11265 [Corynebacterium vitaeruminis DSM 20294]|uniref:Uncharacterized protein n=1 Tax=Corynebacterium vitaeruminis DSM 20294 TaxID=1224164 RepID=W5Y302_9CORY|nr:hypothetical protein B843_11265 [Corynebacterium vitaeruminis DSM 20294]
MESSVALLLADVVPAAEVPEDEELDEHAASAPAPATTAEPKRKFLRLMRVVISAPQADEIVRTKPVKHPICPIQPGCTLLPATFFSIHRFVSG